MNRQQGVMDEETMETSKDMRPAARETTTIADDDEIASSEKREHADDQGDDEPHPAPTGTETSSVETPQAASKRAPQDKPAVKLITADDQSPHAVPYKAAMLLDIVRDTMTDDDHDLAVPLLRVTSQTLKPVIEFLVHYAVDPYDEIPIPMHHQKMEDALPSKWYRDYLARLNDENGQQLFFAVARAASYLNCVPLMHLCNLELVFACKDKDAAWIANYLNMPMPTEKQLVELKKSHKWLFEDTTAEDTN